MSRFTIELAIEFLRNPDQFKTIGAHIPKGILMNGGPGNGKTLLARATAGEVNCPFININGASFVEKYVGMGAQRVRELFKVARELAPCIIFIDEIDALISSRSGSGDSGSKEYNNTINAFLAEMDGFSDKNATVVIIGATNRIHFLDTAAIRPGRFDRIIEIEKPKKSSREKLLQLNLKKVTHAYDLDIDKIAEMTSGFSGADLTNLINQAALLAVRDKSGQVKMYHIEKAFEAIKNSMIAVMNDSHSINIIYPGDMNVTFKDVAGLDGAKEDLQDIIEFLKNPEQFKIMGAHMPKGILMNGSPGNGKTLLARAAAGEINCPFINIQGSDFTSKWAGTGKEMVTKIFEIAREIAPCIIFID